MQVLCQLLRNRCISFAFLLALALIPHSQAMKVVVFYALDIDGERISEGLSQATGKNRNPLPSDFYILEEKKVRLEKMTPGPVSTAWAAASVAETFSPALIISIGPAGALDPEMAIGDIGLVTSIIPYQQGTWTESGFEARQTSIQIFGIDRFKDKAVEIFGIDSPASNLCAASGEAFVASESQTSFLRDRLGASLVEMNLFGLVGSDRTKNIPGLHVRIVSDFADSNARDDFLEFVDTYKGDLGRETVQLILNLPADPRSPANYEGLRNLLE